MSSSPTEDSSYSKSQSIELEAPQYDTSDQTVWSDGQGMPLVVEVTSPQEKDKEFAHFVATGIRENMASDIELSGHVKPKGEAKLHQNTEKHGVEVLTDKFPSFTLFISNDSPLIEKHWIPPQGHDTDSEDPMTLIENLKLAIKEVADSGKKLEHCLVDTMYKHNQTKEQLAICESKLEDSKRSNVDSKLCGQELHEYKQKCDKVAETERDMTKYYEQQLQHLETKLKSMGKEKDQADVAHRCELDYLERKHGEEKADLQFTLKVLEKELGEKDAIIEEFESISTRFEEKQKEVKKLKETLKERESELQELEQKVQSKAREVKKLEQAKTQEFELEKMTNERKGIQVQLKRCQDIRKLVSRLPTVTSLEDLDRITKEIIDDIINIKATMTRKKAISWR